MPAPPLYIPFLPSVVLTYNRTTSMHQLLTKESTDVSDSKEDIGNDMLEESIVVKVAD